MIETLLPPWVIIAFMFLFGLSFGSFATLASYRIPKREGIFFGSSKCPKCKHKLGILDLFPVFSYLFLRGRCRYCHYAFGSSYPLTEIALGCIFVLTYLKFGISWQTLLLCLVATCLLIIIVIDLEHYIIPNALNLTLFILGILYHIHENTPLFHFIIGPVTGFAIGWSLRQMMWVWKKKEGLGMGDVKFFAVAGLFLQLEVIVPFLFFSGLIGIITAMVWSMAGRGKEFPFGPALAIALFLCLLFPQSQFWLRSLIEPLVERW